MCLVLLATSLLAHPVERERTWEELPVMITNSRIALVLPDGTRLRGIGRGIQGNELIMDVRRSSNKSLHPKGRMAIPRPQVSVIDLYLRRDLSENGRGAAIGAGVGGAVMGGVGVGLGDSGHERLAVVVFVAGASVGAVIGHYVFDRKGEDPSHVRITVLPPATPAVQFR